MLISAKNANNGLKGFYEAPTTAKDTYKGHCITLNNDGDGGVGLAYYQPNEFLLDTHVYALYPKCAMSKYTMLYISQVLSKQRICFSHGHSISQERLKTMSIMLPADALGKPNYAYMEQYGRWLMVQCYQHYFDYISKRTAM